MRDIDLSLSAAYLDLDSREANMQVDFFMLNKRIYTLIRPTELASMCIPWMSNLLIVYKDIISS